MSETCNNTDHGTVRVLLDAIEQCFQGRFEVRPRTNDSMGTVQVWYQLLRDLPARCVLAGGYQLLSELRHPPSPGEVRQAALDIQDGALAPPSPWMAWERVLSACGDGLLDIHDLTAEESRALKMVGGLFGVKSSLTPSYDRRQFCEAYETIMRERRKTIGAIPEVRAVVDDHAPRLPERKPEEVAADDDIETRPASPEEIRDMLKNFNHYKPEWERK